MRLMDPARYEKYKASGRLPSPKGVAWAIIRLLQQDDYKIGDLVRLLQSDPAIAGRLLKFANAAAIGNARPIVAIAKAVLVLGAYRVRDLVLGFSILHGYRDGCSAFDYQRFWSRSLATAIAAQALAKHAQIAAEESFTLGLLCDVGTLALAAYDCERFGEVQGLAGTSPERMVEIERAVFGTDHRELGAALMTEWGLPEALVSAAYHCELPDAAGFGDGSRKHVLTLSLHFARAIAAICVAADAERWGKLPELYAKAARLGIAPDELTTMADEIVGRWRDWGNVLEIHTHDMPPFAELLSSVPPAPQLAADTAAETPVRHGSAVIVGSDDDEAVQLAAMLEKLGNTVQRVANGIDGLMLVLRDNPQLILVDLESPELDGPAFCRAFRDSPLSHEAVLMLFGNPEQEDRLSEAVEAGADDYLLRPVSEQMLRTRLRAVGKLVHLREEIRRERRGLVRSADEWAGSQRRMMHVALTDPLTQLPNRRHGMDFLAAEWAFAHGNNLPLVCMMVDIDHFKAINDRYGHDAGDAVLAGVARILGEHCRSEDMAFRYGGEEFCVVCNNTDMTAARLVAERIRGGVELEHQRVGDEEIAVTVSVGIAMLAPAHADLEALLKDADTALYRAKENGRNRVES